MTRPRHIYDLEEIAFVRVSAGRAYRINLGFEREDKPVAEVVAVKDRNGTWEPNGFGCHFPYSALRDLAEAFTQAADLFDARRSGKRGR